MPPLVIGEGIETAASAGRLMGFSAWAAIAAGNMAKRPRAAPGSLARGDRGGPGRSWPMRGTRRVAAVERGRTKRPDRHAGWAW